MNLFRKRTFSPWNKRNNNQTAVTFTTLLVAGISFTSFADHTSPPSNVTLVGDLQTELSCSNDWQPECSASQLIQDGDNWQATFVIPAGEWQYKIAVNNSWDESYGNNGDNISLYLPEAREVTFSYNHSSHQVSDDAPVVIKQPALVALVGDLQSELGCSGDWQPECTATQLTLDESDLIWQGTFNIPAGSWQYKTALNGSWDENYGANATRNGSNINLPLAESTSVKFYYDHASHWLANNKTNVIATLAGNFQAQLGCPGDWQPECLRSWLQDADGDGLYSFTTTALTAGNYQVKVAHNESWQENYGANGAQNGANIDFTVSIDNAPVTFTYQPDSHQLTIGSSGFDANLKQAKAYWLSEDTLAYDVPQNTTVTLHYSESAALTVTPDGLVGGEHITLQANGVIEGDIAEKFRHLAGLPAFKISAQDLSKVPAILKSQYALVAQDSEGQPLSATGIQPPGVLDDLYTFDGKLGVNFDSENFDSENHVSLSVWAPSARSLKLHLFDDSDATTSAQVLPMLEDSATGVWHIAGDSSWQGKYYLFEVEVYSRATGNIEHNLVTDPYSVSLSINSKRSQIVNLNDEQLKPLGWDKLAKPRLNAPEDQAIYELHVRDFSIHDQTVPEEMRGTFKAFAYQQSNGSEHLRKLAHAGLTSIHLLPAFDCATIEEDKTAQLVTDDLSVFSGDSTEQQAAVDAIRGQDGFNWCYDPYHYTVPEGSYATDANGSTRIREFRDMVASLNKANLRVIMDVVYNHTSGSLQGEKSVLDKIVPDYYHRLNSIGDIEMSSCCANTATEHNMMEKLMLDSLKTWATDYKVDGFRFDLMGHHTKENLLKAQAMLHSLTLEHDGVDGSSIYLYGEGWNFGEVVNNTRFEQASQRNMGDHTGIGSFNDHIRDAVRGGGPFDSGNAHVANQGFINGLYYDANSQSQATLADLLHTTDKVRMSLAGTLSNYQFTDHLGNQIASSAIGGYTSDPQEAINYIAAHDNETLFDASQYKLPLSTSKADRVRVQNLGNAIVALAQGIPFYHAGQDMLRSKSSDRNSYDAGDWFNILDFSYTENGWARGLPLQGDNEANWQVSQPRLANPDLAVGSSEITSAVAHMQEMMTIRRSSSLFRLQTADEVNNQLRFHNTGPNQTPGLIVMSLSKDDDIKHVVLFNASTQAQTFTLEALTNKEKFMLHPVQKSAKDKIVRQAKFNAKQASFTVPARTTAVFVKPNTVNNGRDGR
ncbi:alpha-1,6-glucosidase [Thalassotalea insulae]|uniref:Alpha-1,6-glucosidase n=1 Tax=Thalassotalea insulae TaxID=2056778 RepID=A0ABQ6GXX5_9GAMM|nr:pullulanase-type alpha-1,6-glucosidase [Thalassotalea insulae]GLX79457.1 alpha-1,6-glucosidase [Thalassotalea insulae]